MTKRRKIPEEKNQNIFTLTHANNTLMNTKLIIMAYLIMRQVVKWYFIVLFKSVCF
jgi:hypothetical protein